jgi:hypothetical protein
MKLVFAIALCLACQNPNVAPVISNGAACAIDVIEDITVAVDVVATAKNCGIAAADIYALVTSLLANMPETSGTSVTTHNGATIARGDYVSHLQQWQAAAKLASK